MSLRSTTEIVRRSPAAVLSGLKSDSSGASKEAGMKLVKEAASFGLAIRDYLRLAIDPRMAEGEERASYITADGNFINGYEATLTYLNLPVRDDLDGGIMLQAAADTFQKFPGSRLMFPSVVDDIVKWRYRQTQFENISGLVSQSRTVAGVEMLSTVVTDEAADYQVARAISEGAKIPLHSIRMAEQSVKWWKFGTGYKTSYEFNRRASLDILTPYALRTQKEIERAKVATGTAVLINGDGVNIAAPVVAAASYDAVAGSAAVSGKLDINHLAAWFAARAQAGAPIDTVLGNWDMYLKWILTFALPTSSQTVSEAQRMASTGMRISTSNLLNFDIHFELSTTMPANQLLGFSVADTMEEVIETGSQIEESERSITTQEVTYVKTETSGFKLIFGDTRSILNIA